LAMESNVLMTDSKFIAMESKIMSVSSRTQRRGDVEPPSGAECATTSLRVRRVRNGESRCQAPERGESKVARTAVDEVAVTDLARTDCDVDGASRGVCKSIYTQCRVDCRHEKLSRNINNE
jgi:hypothetical protein